MKKASTKSENDMRAEYDFASMKGGVRGKYAKQYRAGTNLVLLDPKLAEVFPTDAAVNNALRAVLNMSKVVCNTFGGHQVGRTGDDSHLRSSRLLDDEWVVWVVRDDCIETKGLKVV